MMSLDRAKNVQVHQPEGNPLKNICTTIKLGLVQDKKMVENNEDQCRTEKSGTFEIEIHGLT